MVCGSSEISGEKQANLAGASAYESAVYDSANESPGDNEYSLDTSPGTREYNFSNVGLKVSKKV